MLRLLHIEFLKVKSYPTFWVFMGSYVLLILLFSSSSSPSATDPAALFLGTPSVWNKLVQNASFFNLLLGILTILLVTNEFTFRTFRQNIVDGLSRAEAITAKFILVLAIALVCILFLFVYGTIKGFTTGQFEHLGGMFTDISYLFKLFLQMLGYMSIAALLAFLIKRAALAIVAYLIYMVPLERLLWFSLPDELDRYLPVHVLSSLVPIDFFEMFSRSIRAVEPLQPEVVYMLAVIYAGLCYTGARALMQRSAL